MRHEPGQYAREAMPQGLRRFAPLSAHASLLDLDLEMYRSHGKRVLLLDMDNTVVPWRTHEVPDEVREFLRRAQDLGYKICAVSNTSRMDRLREICGDLGIEHVRARNKPSRRMFVQALRLFQAEPHEALMVGDQLMTDVLGANRAGIDAIWVAPMSKKEFIGTKVNRMVESVVGKFLYRYFQPSVAFGVAPKREGLFKHQVVKEFLKFGIVGATSTALDWGLHYLLMYKATWSGQLLSEVVGAWMLGMVNPGAVATEKALSDAAYAPLKILPVLIAIFNGYYWNSKWTFRVAERTLQAKLISRFYIVALAAMVVNLVVSTSVKIAVHGSAQKAFWVASFVGMIVAAFVNFIGQRQWTFRDTKRLS